MKRLINWIQSLAWDRILLLSTSAAILIYVDWRLAIAVTLVSWAIIRGINEVMKNVAAALTVHQHNLDVLSKGLMETKQKVRKLEGGGDYVH